MISDPHDAGRDAPLLRIRDLCVSRGDQPVLRGVDLVLRPGKVTALVGVSGSGKTTLARAVLRLLTPREGTITCGAVALRLPAARRSVMLTDISLPHMCRYRGRHIALVPQDPRSALNPVRRLGSLFAEVLRRDGRGLRVQRDRDSAGWLARVGLDHPRERLRQFAHELSGGMQQRVLIALALAAGAEVILADEPTAALDKPIEAELVTWLRTLQKRHHFAMLWMSHDMTLVSAHADELAVLHEGRIVECGPASRVWARPRHALTRALKEAAGDGWRDGSKSA